MKKGLSALFLAVLSSAALGQGLVNFINNSTTLVSIVPPSGSVVISGASGSYYFALLTAAAGTTDPAQFQFAAYGTNVAAAGRISGGTGVAIPGWLPGTTRAFEVVGWSSDFGHDFNQSWLANPPWYQGNWFGISSIGSGSPGGYNPNTGQTDPNLSIFGGAPSISFGIPLSLIPEPGICSFAGVASCIVLLSRRSLRRSHAQRLASEKADRVESA